MNNILDGELKIDNLDGEFLYLSKIFGDNSIINFGDNSKISNNENYFSIIFGENGVGKTSFLKYIINQYIKSNISNQQLMFITFSIFDEMISSNIENKERYIYNGIKSSNNSANKKSIYNINKIKLFVFLKKDSSKTLELLKYIYKYPTINIDDLKVSISIINNIADNIGLFEDNRDLLDNIKIFFDADEKYNITSKGLSDKNILSLYYVIKILKEINYNDNVVSIEDFFRYEDAFNNKLGEYNERYKQKIRDKFDESFQRFKNQVTFLNYAKDDRSLGQYTDEEIKENLYKLVVDNSISIGYIKWHIKKEGKYINIGDIMMYFNFFNEEFKLRNEIYNSNLYDLFSISSKIRQKNWGKEVFEYDLGIIDKNRNINLFGNSSSGQLVMLYTYLHLTDFNINNSGSIRGKQIIIIDEPEISLHPEWQRDYLLNLNNGLEILGINNTFFIITTHSPLILLSGNSDGYNSDLYNFIKKDGVTFSKKISDVHTFSIDELLSKDFGVKLITENQESNIKNRYNDLLNNLS